MRLHSNYDPSGEARKFLDLMVGSRHPSCILILGGAEDWLSEAAKIRFPSSLVVSVQYDPRFRGSERQGADARWYPDDSISLRSFLLRGLAGRTDGGVSVVSWKPSESAFPEAAEQAWRCVREVLEEISADGATLRYWSFLWARNALKTFSRAERFLAPPRLADPIVVAAAGPTLEASLQALLPYRGRVRLWSLSSAYAACVFAHWQPDLVVSTDAGFWCDRHFDALCRYGSPRTPVASLLTARIPREVLSSRPILLLSQGHPLETDLASAGGLPFHPTRPRGTASADAISLALGSTSGPVLVAGLDMASLDLRSHCRPHGFDADIRRSESRARPHLTLLWERESEAFPFRFGEWRRGRSFDLYAAGAAADLEKPVYRLSPSPVPVPGMIPLEPGGLAGLLEGRSPLSEYPFSLPQARKGDASRETARRVLESWEAEASDAVLNAREKSLSERARYLLYALGGPDAAAFLAEAARMRHDARYAAQALDAVHASARRLMEAVS